MQNWFSPAKINLYLAILGVRADGFHELDSIVALLDFGDEINVGLSESGQDEYHCNVDGLGYSPDNLIYKAIQLYRSKTGFDAGITIDLNKRIPMGAGLGGGSSNASTVLKALNSLNSGLISLDELKEWSAELGSDCPLFFNEGITRIRGRGEIVEAFTHNFSESLDVGIFHPGFGVTAAWAYKTFRQNFSEAYPDVDLVKKEIQKWSGEQEPWNEYYRNDLCIPVDSKYLAIPSVKEEFQKEFGRPLFMSGSGSSCFCFIKDDQNEVSSFMKKCWGQESFQVFTGILL